jgi:hypothetical protein
MKPICILLLSALSLTAADDLTVATTTKTNEYSVTTKEYFMRAGQTNMLRSTTRYSTNDVIKSRSYFFFHRGQRVAAYQSSPTHGYTYTRSVTGYSVGFESVSNVLSEVVLYNKEGEPLDMFVATNGVLIPLPSSELRKYVATPKDRESDDK